MLRVEQCDSKDGISLFDLTSGASAALAADADSTVRSQWTTHDAAARLAVRSHLPSFERTHFSQYKSAKILYNAVAARYSSPATAALSRLMLPYLFPDLAAFATVADLITHLRTSDTRYRAALPAEDHFLSFCPTTLTVDLLEERLLAAETRVLPSSPFGLRCLCYCCRRAAGAAGGAAGAGATGAAGGAAGVVGCAAGATGGAASAGAAGATGGAAGGAAGARAAGAAGATGAAGGAAGTGDPGAEGTGSVSAVSGGAARPRPYYVPLLQHVLGFPPSPGSPPPFPSPPPVQSQSQLHPASPLPGPSPYSGPTRGLTECPELESRRVSPESRSELPVCTVRAGRVSRTRPPPVPCTHSMTLRPSNAPQRACRLLLRPLFLPVRTLRCFAASVPHLVSMLIAPEGDWDGPDIPTPHSYAEAIEGPYSSQWQAAMDAKMASWKSTGTYVDEVPPPGANIVSGMWILRVKRPPGSPPAFKAQYVARGFSQRQGVYFFQTFSPTLKMTTLLHVAAQRDYELHSLDFSTTFLQGSLHEEIWLRRPPGFTGSFPAGTQWSFRRTVYGLRQAPREWHDTLRTTLAVLGFAPSTADPSLFLRTDTTLPPFYVLVYVDDLVFAIAHTKALAHVLHRFGFTYSSPQSTPLPTGHSLSAPPSDESVEPSGPYPELVGCLMYLMTCTRPDLAYPLSLLARYMAPGRHRKVHWDAAKRVLRYLCSTSGMGLMLGGRARVVLTGHVDASWVDDLAMQRSTQGYTFSLGSGSVSWRPTRSSFFLSSNCEAEIYVGAMAAQELRWLTYLLTDLGEAPRSPPVLCGHALHPPLVSTYAALPRRAACCRAAPPGTKPHRPAEPRRPAEPHRTIEPRHPAEPRCPSACTASAATAATAATTSTAATAATTATTAMATPTVLTFDAEGRAVDFDVWIDDLQLFLQCDSRDGVSLFDHTSAVSTAPAATADNTVRSQWTTRDAVARLAVRSHLPSAERAHFGQYKTARSLYDAVVARYSSPATAALSRLMLPYLFPDLAAFATVADLITHFRTSDAHYRDALPPQLCAKNPPPMYITLNYLVTRLPDSLALVRDHFLSLCPSSSLSTC
ncbi:unnamed protein product [Closterium sp. NIES-53]